MDYSKKYLKYKEKYLKLSGGTPEEDKEEYHKSMKTLYLSYQAAVLDDHLITDKEKQIGERIKEFTHMYETVLELYYKLNPNDNSKIPLTYDKYYNIYNPLNINLL